MMGGRRLILTGLILCAVLSSARAGSFDWHLPRWMPEPVVPEDNPMSDEKVELGRRLFYDTRLSVNGTVACASCHRQALAFTDGRAVAIGATGERHPRGAMSLANAAYSPVLTWANPLVHELEQQALTPMFGEAPIEMGLAGREDAMVAWLTADADYAARFRRSFPDQTIAIATITKAIAAFERTLISVGSPYDRYRFDGGETAISDQAKRGEALFFGEKFECYHCHGGLTFSDNLRHANLRFVETAFHNTGLYNIDGKGAYPWPNTGVMAVTNNPADMGQFRAPSLRNIAVTAPYMHDGSIPTLEAVIDHYAAGGRTIGQGPNEGDGSESPLRDPLVGGFVMGPGERDDLIAFLRSLTDEGFLTDPRLSDPFAERRP
jgi:cytochrome c peroxidase